MEAIAAVDRALARPETRQILAATAIEREVVLTVARFEASEASDRGASTLSHARLAQLAGLPRADVLRARLALIELGLDYLAAAARTPGSVQRVLHHR